MKKIEIEKFLSGYNPLKYVTRIEASPFSSDADVFIDNPKNGKKGVMKVGYEKFLFIRDLDRYPNFLKKRLREANALLADTMKQHPDIEMLKEKVESLKEEAKELRKERRALDKQERPDKARLSEIEVKISEITDMRENYVDTIDKFDKDRDFALDMLDDAKEAMKAIDLIPPMDTFMDGVEEYNRKKRLQGNRAVFVERLDLQVDHQRLRDGYTYKVWTNGKYKDLAYAMGNGGLPIWGDSEAKEAIKETDCILKPRLEEMAYISTGIRNFKGMELEDVHIVHYDLETTGLIPMTATCKKCSKKYEMSNPKDIPKYCSEKKSDGKYCGCEDFDVSHTDTQVFISAILDSREGEKMFFAEVDGDGGIDREQEKQLVKDTFSYFGDKKPAIITGYNNTFFDDGMILSKAEEYGIGLSHEKCFSCGRGHYARLEDGWQCDECSHVITDSKVAQYMEDASLLVQEKNMGCPECRHGMVVKGKTKYGCNKFKQCGYREDFDVLESDISKKLERLVGSVQSTASYKHPFMKQDRDSALKTGGDTSFYKASEAYGINVVDTWFQSLRAKAINSSIKSTSLKYMEGYVGANKDRPRTYIPHDRIASMYKEDAWFIVTSDNIYKEVVGDEAQYIEMANDKSRYAELPDIKGKSRIPNRDYGKGDDKPSDIEGGGDNGSNKQMVTVDNLDFIKDNCGDFRLMKGSDIVKAYAFDDVYGEREVFLNMGKERFLTNRFFPTNFDRFATMGVASSWNLLTMAYCYDAGIAIPHSIIGKIPVGGLSRMWVRGFEEGIQKVDFASLYPTLMLTLDIYPKFAPYVIEFLEYFYNVRMYWNTRKKNKDPEKLLDFLEEDGHDMLGKVKALYDRMVEGDEGAESEFDAFMSDYKAKADDIQLPSKININAIFGWISSMVSLVADMDEGCQITSSGRMKLRGAKAFFSAFVFKPLVCDTDGINLSKPLMIDRSIETFLPLDTPIPLEDVEWNGKKGVGAFLARYNEMMLPEDCPMSLDNDGEWVRCFNAAKKNYINLEPWGEVKMTGNSFKDSSMPDMVQVFLKNEVAKAMKDKDMGYLIKQFNRYSKVIKEGRLPLKFAVKKAKNKAGVDEYLNRGYTKRMDKEGNPIQKAKQAHMELQIAADKKIEVGQTVYYVNNGTSASSGDADIVTVTEKALKKSYECVSCNKVTVNKPESCTSKIKHKCGCDDFREVAEGVWECFNCNAEKKAKNQPKRCTSVVKTEVCGDREYRELQILDCCNPKCNKQHNVSMDDIDIDEEGIARIAGEDGYQECGRKTNGVKCDCDEFRLVYEDVPVGERLASYLVSDKELLEKGNEPCEYNRKAYYKIFANKFEPFKYLFPPEMRADLIPDFDKEPVYTGDEDITPNSEPLDSITESFTLEEKEMEFWRSTGLNPLELMPYFSEKIILPSELPEWDEFNEFVDMVNRKKRLAGDTTFSLRRSMRYAKTGGLFAEKLPDGNFGVFRKLDKENKKQISTWDRKKKTWV